MSIAGMVINTVIGRGILYKSNSDLGEQLRIILQERHQTVLGIRAEHIFESSADSTQSTQQHVDIPFWYIRMAFGKVFQNISVNDGYGADK